MNALKRYFRKINHLLPIATSKRETLLRPLYYSLQEYAFEHPDCTYNDFIFRFGSPTDVVSGILSTSPDLATGIAIQKKHTIIFSMILSVILITIIVLLAYFLFQKQLCRTIYIETTIQYICNFIFMQKPTLI